LGNLLRVKPVSLSKSIKGINLQLVPTLGIFQNEKAERWSILAQCVIEATLTIAISDDMSKLPMLASGHVKIVGRHLTGKITSTTIKEPAHSIQQGFDHQHRVEVEIWRTSKGGSLEVQH
jgi:hypothetical protein